MDVYSLSLLTHVTSLRGHDSPVELLYHDAVCQASDTVLTQTRTGAVYVWALSGGVLEGVLEGGGEGVAALLMSRRLVPLQGVRSVTELVLDDPPPSSSSSSSSSHPHLRVGGGVGGRREGEGDHNPGIVDVYENQRWLPLVGWSGRLLPTDRPGWSDDRGRGRRREDCVAEGGWRWVGEWEVVRDERTDVDGWSYAVDFNAGGRVYRGYHRRAFLHSVRRRRWVRRREWMAQPSPALAATLEAYIEQKQQQHEGPSGWGGGGGFDGQHHHPLPSPSPGPSPASPISSASAPHPQRSPRNTPILSPTPIQTDNRRAVHPRAQRRLTTDSLTPQPSKPKPADTHHPTSSTLPSTPSPHSALPALSPPSVRQTSDAHGRSLAPSKPKRGTLSTPLLAQSPPTPFLPTPPLPLLLLLPRPPTRCPPCCPACCRLTTSSRRSSGSSSATAPTSHLSGVEEGEGEEEEEEVGGEEGEGRTCIGRCRRRRRVGWGVRGGKRRGDPERRRTMGGGSGLRRERSASPILAGALGGAQQESKERSEGEGVRGGVEEGVGGRRRRGKAKREEKETAADDFSPSPVVLLPASSASKKERKARHVTLAPSPVFTSTPPPSHSVLLPAPPSPPRPPPSSTSLPPPAVPPHPSSSSSSTSSSLTSSPLPTPIVIRVEVWENQRRWPLLGWSSRLLPTDPFPPSSDASGHLFTFPMADVELGASMRWLGDWQVVKGGGGGGAGGGGGGETDGEGWQYAVDWGWEWGGEMRVLTTVRRRRWVREKGLAMQGPTIESLKVGGGGKGKGGGKKKGGGGRAGDPGGRRKLTGGLGAVTRMPITLFTGVGGEVVDSAGGTQAGRRKGSMGGGRGDSGGGASHSRSTSLGCAPSRRPSLPTDDVEAQHWQMQGFYDPRAGAPEDL